MESSPVAPAVGELKANIAREVTLLVEWILTCQSLTFFAFEPRLVPNPGSQRRHGRATRQRQSVDGMLEAPINKKVHASYAPKRHAVAIARREADKRGF